MTTPKLPNDRPDDPPDRGPDDPGSPYPPRTGEPTSLDLPGPEEEATPFEAPREGDHQPTGPVREPWPAGSLDTEPNPA
jgi:hypothetical protein